MTDQHVDPRSLQVDFVVRSDAGAKSGGDTVQVDAYLAHLSSAGIDTRVLPFTPKLRFRPGAIVHIVNIDRPYDFLVTSNAAKGHPVVVTPIHHKLEYVRYMRLGERGYGVRSVVGRLLPESHRELLAFAVRSVRAAESATEALAACVAFFRCAPMSIGVWKQVGRALGSAGKVLVLAQGEASSLTEDTGWQGANSATVPNGSPSEIPNGLDWPSRDIPIISVGRVEPRKRQLEFTKLAAQIGQRITLVGPLHAPESAFGQEFLALVAANPVIEWRGGIPHEEVLALLKRSRVLVNPSWVEVQSLVDLEAAFNGCYVVANSGGNSKEWLPQHVREHSVFDLEGMLHESITLADSVEGPGYPDYKWTWADAGQALVDTYVEVSKTKLGAPSGPH